LAALSGWIETLSRPRRRQPRVHSGSSSYDS
jgi:hypothetical protein